MTEVEFQLLRQSVDALNKRMDVLTEKQERFLAEHYEGREGLIKLTQEVQHINHSLESLNNGISKILFIIGGGFLMAFVAWVVGGGLGTGNH